MYGGILYVCIYSVGPLVLIIVLLLPLLAYLVVLPCCIVVDERVGSWHVVCKSVFSFIGSVMYSTYSLYKVRVITLSGCLIVAGQRSSQEEYGQGLYTITLHFETH